MSMIPAIAPNAGAAPETVFQLPEAEPFAMVAAQAMERSAAAAAPEQGDRDPDGRKLPLGGQALPPVTGQPLATDVIAASGFDSILRQPLGIEPSVTQTGTDSATQSPLQIDEADDANATLAPMATASWLIGDWHGLIESSVGRESGAPATPPDPATQSLASLASANPQLRSLLNSAAAGVPGDKAIADTPNVSDSSLLPADAAAPFGDASRFDPFTDAWTELFGGRPVAESLTSTRGAGGPPAALDTAAAPLPADLMGRVVATTDLPVRTDLQYALAGTTPTGNALPAMSGAGVEHAMRLPQPLTDPQWPAQFATRVEWLVGNGAGDARIQINPPELGPIDIQISMHDDQARIHFTVQHAAVRDAVEESLPRLREMLQQSGLQLADADVSAERQGQPRHDPMFDSSYLPHADRYAAASTESLFAGSRFFGTGLVDTFV